MLHGVRDPSRMYVGKVPPIGPLSDGSFIPAMNLHDGPQGVSNQNTQVDNVMPELRTNSRKTVFLMQVTCWPSALTLAQSWDRAAVYDFGTAIAAEQFKKGTTVMLGPTVNLARVPWSGRT